MVLFRVSRSSVTHIRSCFNRWIFAACSSLEPDGYGCDDGDDIIDLGLGDDYATGGTGTDTFIFKDGYGSDEIGAYLAIQ